MINKSPDKIFLRKQLPFETIKSYFPGKFISKKEVSLELLPSFGKNSKESLLNDGVTPFLDKLPKECYKCFLKKGSMCCKITHTTSILDVKQIIYIKYITLSSWKD